MSDWTRQGECNHCGWCCEKVAREAIVRTATQLQSDPAFYAARGFKPMQVDGETKHVLFAWLEAPCPQLRIEQIPYGLGGMLPSSRCGIYETRPQTCADYPRLPVDIVGTPCSYWFERGTDRVGGTGSPFPADEHALLRMEGHAA